ncbi:hypothetical protein [Enterococcus olivae]
MACNYYLLTTHERGVTMDEFVVDDEDLDEEYYEAEDLGIY